MQINKGITKFWWTERKTGQRNIYNKFCLGEYYAFEMKQFL